MLPIIGPQKHPLASLKPTFHLTASPCSHATPSMTPGMLAWRAAMAACRRLSGSASPSSNMLLAARSVRPHNCIHRAAWESKTRAHAHTYKLLNKLVLICTLHGPLTGCIHSASFIHNVFVPPAGRGGTLAFKTLQLHLLCGGPGASQGSKINRSSSRSNSKSCCRVTPSV